MTTLAAPPRTAAATLADVCHSLRWANLSADVQDRTRELVLDLLGVALAGSRQPSSSPVAEASLRLGGAGRASLIGTAGQTSAVFAALANGTAAHAVELDDVTTESSLHPGVAVVPPALALAEELGASPAALFEAIVSGYEVTMRVGNALNPASAYARGFHPTGVAGVFGATMAAGRLLGLDVEGLIRALGIAGTMASGSLEYLSDGAWTKRLNAGWAGHAGITAASLAQAGFTGPATVFEGRLGVLHAYTDAPFAERLLADLGDPWQVMRVSIKPYACCRYNHGLIDGVLRLVAEHRLEHSDVDRIHLGVLSGGALLVADPIEQKRHPQGVVDAQFSAPYAAATALVYGTGGIDAYTPEKLSSPLIASLMERTDCSRDPSLDAVYPRQWPATVSLDLKDGTTVSTRVEYATGEPENPVTREALIAKFMGLAADSVADPASLAQRILSMATAADLQALTATLRG
ncbi:MAG TPA: MmgE/PrpD family protein [Chloroflexota bacterium]|jgi:2-methylcitrate dehydratase PrpD|nr:MmgE/PrpD family protein [Chloroflexota bacterium]